MKILSPTPFYVTADLLKRWFARHNPYAIPPAEFYLKFGKQYGVHAGLAFCQMCHETGFLRYGGDVKKEQNNFAGIGAIGGGNPGESYATIELGVKAHIQNLALYGGKKISVEYIISQRAKNLYDLYLGRSLTWEGLQGTWAMDNEYWNKLSGIYNNLTDYLDTVSDYDVNCDGIDVFGDGSTLITVAEPGLLRVEQIKPSQPTDPIPTPTPSPNRGKICLSVGHSARKAGAAGRNPAVKEYDMARFQTELVDGYLRGYGVDTKVTDRPDDDLLETGAEAAGHDIFIEFHFNAHDRAEHYTTCLVHPSIDAGGSPSSKLASLLAINVANAIGNSVFSGSRNYPKGVMAVKLTVLRAAATAGCPVRVLLETEFIDDEVETTGIKQRIQKSAPVIAKTLVEFLNNR